MTAYSSGYGRSRAAELIRKDVYIDCMVTVVMTSVTDASVH